MKMMRPLRARSMPCVALLATRYAAVRFASNTDVKSSSPMRNNKPSRVMPAFDTSTSTASPNSSSTAANAPSTAAASVTSHLTANNSSGGGELLKVTATRSPDAWKRRAHARPIPRDPPVTSTTRGARAGSVIQATAPAEDAGACCHPTAEADEQHEITVVDAALVERVG